MCHFGHRFLRSPRSATRTDPSSLTRLARRTARLVLASCGKLPPGVSSRAPCRLLRNSGARQIDRFHAKSGDCAFSRTMTESTKLDRLKTEAAFGRPYADRLSTALSKDLLHRLQTQGEYWAVLDAINELEGMARATSTKPATAFRKAPLAPLWHKHFAGAGQIAAYLCLERSRKGVTQKCVEEAAAKAEADPRKLALLLAHSLTVQAWEDRCERDAVTGNWLIFAKHDGRNYYLIATKHGKRSQDTELHQRIVSECCDEWPWLFPSDWA